MSRHVIVALLSLPLMLGVVHGTAAKTAVTVSKALSALIGQVNDTYLSRRNENFQDVVNSRSPVIPAILLGVAVHGQTENPDLFQVPDPVERIKALQEEIRRFLDVVLRSRDYRDADGSELTTDELYYTVFLPSVRGESNELMVQWYGVDPARVRHNLYLGLVNLPPSGRPPPSRATGRAANSPGPGSNRASDNPFDDGVDDTSLCFLGEC